MVNVSLLLVIICVNVIMVVMYKKENSSKYGNVIRYPKFYLWLGVVGLIFISVILMLMTLYPNDTADGWVYALFSAFWLLGAGIIMAYMNWFIIIEKDHFIYRSIFRKTYKIFYTDVIDCKIKENDVIIKTKDNKFDVDRNLPGVLELGQRLRSQTRKNAK